MTTTTTKEQEFLTSRVGIDRITFGTMYRPDEPTTVAMLKGSIATVGLINPLTVKKMEDDTYELLAGYNRLQALKELGWSSIPVHIVEQAELESEWTTIQENLSRKDLTVLDLAWSLGRSKEIYDELHPEAGHGKKTKDGPKVESFLDYEVNAHKRSRASIAMYTYIYNHLDPSLYDQLREDNSITQSRRKLADTLKDLYDLASQTMPNQKNIVEHMAYFGVSYKTAKRYIVKEEKPQTPHEDDQHEEPKEPEAKIEAPNEPQPCYVTMDSSIARYEDAKEGDPDPDIFDGLPKAEPEYCYVKPDTRIRVKKNNVVIEIVKDDPTYLKVYQLEEKEDYRNVEEFRHIQFSYYWSKDEV